MHKNTGRTSEKFMRLDQDRIDVKTDVKGKVLIMCSGRQSVEDFGIKGRSGECLRWLILKVREPITGSDLRVGLNSPPPQFYTRGVELGLMSGEILLESREERSRRKEGLRQ